VGVRGERSLMALQAERQAGKPRPSLWDRANATLVPVVFLSISVWIGLEARQVPFGGFRMPSAGFFPLLLGLTLGLLFPILLAMNLYGGPGGVAPRSRPGRSGYWRLRPESAVRPFRRFQRCASWAMASRTSSGMRCRSRLARRRPLWPRCAGGYRPWSVMTGSRLRCKNWESGPSISIARPSSNSWRRITRRSGRSYGRSFRSKASRKKGAHHEDASRYHALRFSVHG
jgi:hypothetical protein